MSYYLTKRVNSNPKLKLVELKTKNLRAVVEFKLLTSQQQEDVKTRQLSTRQIKVVVDR